MTIRMILCGLLMSVSASAVELDSNVLNQLEADLESGTYTGAAILVVDGDDTKFYGLGKRAHDDDVTPDAETQFEIGSISKVFTAQLLADRLVSGSLTLETTIGEVLGDKARLKPAIAAITLKQLATHQSGLPRLPGNLNMTDMANPYAHYGFDQMLAYLESIDAGDLESPSSYSNLGSGLLGQLLAIESGQTYEALLKQTLFDPLGMARSSIDPLLENVATGHANGSATPYWDLNSHAPAGAIMSSINDMERFLRAYMDNPDAARKLTLQSYHMSGESHGSGLGWQIRVNDQGNTQYWHNGGTGGFRSMMAFDASQRQGIIMLINETAYDPTSAAVIHLTAALNEERPSEELPLSDYLGHFALNPSFSISFTERYGNLQAQATGQPAFPLSPSGEDQFTIAAVGAVISFHRDDEGKVQSMTLDQGGAKQRGTRVAAAIVPKQFTAIEIDASVLSDYHGQYQLTPAMVFTIRSEGNQLMAGLTGQPEVAVFPYETDKFFYKIVDAQLEFQRDEAGKVTGLILNQSGRHPAAKIE